MRKSTKQETDMTIQPTSAAIANRPPWEQRSDLFHPVTDIEEGETILTFIDRPRALQRSPQQTGN
jgi:hypothetical protein